MLTSGTLGGTLPTALTWEMPSWLSAFSACFFLQILSLRRETGPFSTGGSHLGAWQGSVRQAWRLLTGCRDHNRNTRTLLPDSWHQCWEHSTPAQGVRRLTFLSPPQLVAPVPGFIAWSGLSGLEILWVPAHPAPPLPPPEAFAQSGATPHSQEEANEAEADGQQGCGTGSHHGPLNHPCPVSWSPCRDETPA